jgi:hypothetical protein
MYSTAAHLQNFLHMSSKSRRQDRQVTAQRRNDVVLLTPWLAQGFCSSFQIGAIAHAQMLLAVSMGFTVLLPMLGVGLGLAPKPMLS